MYKVPSFIFLILLPLPSPPLPSPVLWFNVMKTAV